LRSRAGRRVKSRQTRELQRMRARRYNALVLMRSVNRLEFDVLEWMDS
jgi:hypothetical protein